MTYWLTRDLVGGQLSASIDVWLVKPTRRRYGHDVTWHCHPGLVETGEGPVQPKFASWSLAHSLRQCGTYPDDELMIIRVGEEPAPPAEETVS